MSRRDSVAAVTGAASVIGRAGGQVRAVIVDVSDQGEAALSTGSPRAGGRLDVLVNAAGISSSGPSSRGPVIRITEQD